MRLLNSKKEELLRDERKVMNDLQLILENLGIEAEDKEALQQSIQQLDDLFLIVVVGEFNSGKSAVINALLGQRILDEGVTPTTTKIQILRYGEKLQKEVTGERQIMLTFPADFLQHLSIVDTPGTNAIIREHEVITSRFIPRSDLVLFITSADRPFTESERIFLEHIRQWGKKIVFVINKIDILKNEEEKEQIGNFVQNNARLFLGNSPVIFSISAYLAMEAKQGQGNDLWEKSSFASLEKYIRDTLDEEHRFRLKLLNPLGIGLRLTEKYLEMIASRLKFLQIDFDLLEDIERQLSLYREDRQHDFAGRLAEVEKPLYEMEKRGQFFFEETFRLGRIFDLLSQTRIRQEFEHRVVADTPRQIEEKIREIINWLVDSDLKQWQNISQYLTFRLRDHKSALGIDLSMGSFHRDRQAIINRIIRETRRVVETYDRDGEAKSIATSAQGAIATSAALEAGAIGLGTLVTTLATTAAADVTGIIMAGFMAALGFFIIPARRRQGKTKFLTKIAAVRTQLIDSLGKYLNEEIDRSLGNIRETLAPYTRFIRSERDKIMESQIKLQQLTEKMIRLKERIEQNHP